MIENDQQLETTQKRILEFQRILAQLRVTARAEEFQAVTGGYLHELERMQDEVLKYLSCQDRAASTASSTN
jgi:hypothetical protein